MQDGFIGLKARPLRGQPGARELYVQSANLESELALLVGSKASEVVRRRGAAENLRSPISFRHISPSVRVSSATYDWLACLGDSQTVIAITETRIEGTCGHISCEAALSFAGCKSCPPCERLGCCSV